MWLKPLRYRNDGTMTWVTLLARKWQGRRLVPLDTSHVWHRRPSPLAGRRVCVLVCHSGDNRLSRHTLHLAARWRSAGFVVVLVVASERPASFAIPSDGWGFLDGILVRGNSGYDFGSWATALHALPDLVQASLLALANDSVYGPLDSFERLVERVDAADADVVGLVDSYQACHHLQSFLVFYKPRALRSLTFSWFWRGMSGAGREEVIVYAEIPQLSWMLRGRLAVTVLFPSGLPVVNPTLRNWRQLLDAGFPFVKTHLLRENPHGADIEGWDDLVARRGYDPALVREHLGDRYDASAAAAAARRPVGAGHLVTEEEGSAEP